MANMNVYGAVPFATSKKGGWSLLFYFLVCKSIEGVPPSFANYLHWCKQLGNSYHGANVTVLDAC